MKMLPSIVVGIAGLLAGTGPASLTMAAETKVTGEVRIVGDVPEASRIPITKDQEVCGQGQRVVDEVRVGETGGLEDVVVFVDGAIKGTSSTEAPAAEYELLQKGCRFNPFIFAVPKGGNLKIVNGDPLAHNIHAYELIGRARRDLFNFQQPQQGHIKKESMRVRRGNIVQLQCDIHDFMRGWIVVPQNPFSTVASGGKFTITGIPPGEHTLIAFHPVLGTVEQKVTLEEGATVSVNFEFSAQ